MSGLLAEPRSGALTMSISPDCGHGPYAVGSSGSRRSDGSVPRAPGMIASISTRPKVSARFGSLPRESMIPEVYGVPGCASIFSSPSPTVTRSAR